MVLTVVRHLQIMIYGVKRTQDKLDWLVAVIGGVVFMSVTNLSKMTMTQNQHFAGVVNGEKTGRI